jgi:predicted ATP-dependent serine protease
MHRFCMYCKAPLSKKPGQMNCPKCKMLNLPNSGPDAKPESILLSEVKNTEPLKRYDVGWLNPIFGGGLIETSVNLIAGSPGAGKTSLFLMLCDFVLDQIETGEALYIANEQSDKELEGYARRLGVQRLDRIRILNAMGGLQRNLGTILLEYKPKLIILDSLTKMISGESPEEAVFFVETFKEYTIQLKAPTMIVNQINKGGDHAGLNRVLHAGDSVFFLDKDDFTGKRHLYSTKNRFGQSPIDQFLYMMPEGTETPGRLVPIDANGKSEEIDDEEEDDDREE